MMRVPGAYATAVRLPDGTITIKREEFTPLGERYPILKKPFIRGVIGLYESFKIGLATLQLSADLALPPDKTKPQDGRTVSFFSRLTTFFTTVLALALGFALFAIVPLFLTTKLLNIERQAIAFNIVTGVWRVIFFLVYLGLISSLKDIQRLFQYHGAEHKVVYAFENGQDLTVANACNYSTHHPRCGTSFIFIVLLVSILFYALIDTLIIWSLGNINLQFRIIAHLLLLPVVAGIGYELLKLTAKYQQHWLAQALSAPGLWLQYITTKQPDDTQIEVAITALKNAFGDRYQEFVGHEYIAEAID